MRTLHLVGLASLAASVLIGFGCSSKKTVIEEQGGGGTGGGTGGVTTTSHTTTTTSVITTSSTTAPPDESTSCADAIEMTEQENTAGGVFYEGKGVINPAEDADYFKFKVEADTWVGLVTDANPDDELEKVDTVLTLYDETGDTQLAQVDDAYPRVSTDSEMYYYFKTGGTYCLKVEEFSAWAGETPEGDPSFTYRALALPIALDANGVPIYEGYDPDKDNTNISTAKAQALANYSEDAQTGMIFDRVYGSFANTTDVNVFSFVAPATTTGDLAMSTAFPPSDVDGYGSTGTPGLINLKDDKGVIVAQLDYVKGSDGFSTVPVTAGKTYFLEINRPPSAKNGANDFWFVKLFSNDTLNPQETDESGNGTGAGAEVASGQANPNNPKVTRFFLGGAIPAADVDWWTISALKDDAIVVACSSQRAGSGVADFTVELFDAVDGAPLQSETETADQDILWSDDVSAKPSKPSVIAKKTADYYLKLGATKMITNGATSTHYLCGVHVTSP